MRCHIASLYVRNFIATMANISNTKRMQRTENESEHMKLDWGDEIIGPFVGFIFPHLTFQEFRLLRLAHRKESLAPRNWFTDEDLVGVDGGINGGLYERFAGRPYSITKFSADVDDRKDAIFFDFCECVHMLQFSKSKSRSFLKGFDLRISDDVFQFCRGKAFYTKLEMLEFWCFLAVTNIQVPHEHLETMSQKEYVSTFHRTVQGLVIRNPSRAHIPEFATCFLRQMMSMQENEVNYLNGDDIVWAMYVIIRICDKDNHAVCHKLLKAIIAEAKNTQELITNGTDESYLKLIPRRVRQQGRRKYLDFNSAHVDTDGTVVLFSNIVPLIHSLEDIPANIKKNMVACIEKLL